MKKVFRFGPPYHPTFGVQALADSAMSDLSDRCRRFASDVIISFDRSSVYFLNTGSLEDCLEWTVFP